MLPFRVFARTEPRSAKLHYRLSSPAASSDPNPFSCSSIQPLSFQTFTDSPPQRTKHISFCSNHLRTFLIATEGIPPLPILELPRHLLFSILFLFMYLREPILQPLSFHIHPGMGGCTPPTPFRRWDVQTCGRPTCFRQSHCGTRTLVPQSAKGPNFFAIRGNNSAPPGV
jgi:hypothetical protein